MLTFISKNIKRLLISFEYLKKQLVTSINQIYLILSDF